MATFGLASALAVGCVSPRASISRAYVDQILADPATHLGRPVRLEGRVEAATAVAGRPPAYALSDASGRSIEVRSQSLPAPGSAVRLLGQVAQDEANVLVPIVIEARRSEGDRPSLLAFGVLGVSGAFFVLVLVLEAAGQLAALRPRPVTRQLPTLGSVPGGEAPATVAPRPYAEGDRFRIRVLAGPDKGRDLLVERRRAYIGRGGSRRNDVELHDATVSRRQAVLCWSRKRQQVLLLNEAEVNPTTVNGAVTSKGPVRHGDVLRLGHTTLQVFFEAAPAAPPAAARPAPEVAPPDPQVAPPPAATPADGSPEPPALPSPAPPPTEPAP
jgi:hypothetical protein